MIEVLNQSNVPPWDAHEFSPVVPPEAISQDTCGYLRAGRPMACSASKLADVVAADVGQQVGFVWVPGMARMAPPEELPFLFDAVKERRRRMFSGSIANGLLFTAIWGATAFIFMDKTSPARPMFIFFMVAFGVIPLCEGLWGRAMLVRFTQDRTPTYASESRYWSWVRDRGSPWTGRLTFLLLGVGLVQLLYAWQHVGDQTRSSLLLAGIDKAAIRNGEVWLLLTGTLVHANLLHFLFNIAALRALGKLVEVLTHWSFVFVVFLGAALLGSLFSLVFMPDTLSVGASGGIMGLLGFLVMIGWRQRSVLPMAFIKAMLLGAFYMAAIGIIGREFIDNAAHAGGFLAGILIGLASKTSRQEIPTGASPRVQLAGRVSWFVTVLLALLVTLLILKGV